MPHPKTDQNCGLEKSGRSAGISKPRSSGNWSRWLRATGDGRAVSAEWRVAGPVARLCARRTNTRPYRRRSWSGARRCRVAPVTSRRALLIYNEKQRNRLGLPADWALRAANGSREQLYVRTAKSDERHSPDRRGTVRSRPKFDAVLAPFVRFFPMYFRGYEPGCCGFSGGRMRPAC